MIRLIKVLVAGIYEGIIQSKKAQAERRLRGL